MPRYDPQDNGVKCYNLAIALLRFQLEARQRIVAALKHKGYN